MAGNDVYIIRITTCFVAIFWAEGETDIFTGSPQRAERFYDLQSALDKAGKLNRVLSDLLGVRFCVERRQK